MPKRKLHLKQHKRNYNLSQETIMQKDENIDWRITLLFYAVMHRVEADCASFCVNNGTHSKRRKYLKKNLRYQNILGVYNSLEELSQEARYNCTILNEEDLSVAIDSFNYIEQFFCNLDSQANKKVL